MSRMVPDNSDPKLRQESYGQHGASPVDHFGVWLSGRAIRRSIRDRQNLDALDLGCGYHAKLLRALRPNLKSGLGVDLQISPEAKAEPCFTYIESTIEQALPSLQASAFDLILMISVLEHLWQPQDALKHCRRMLKPGGVLLLNVPTWRGKFFLEFSAFKLGTSPALEMDDHKIYYDKRDLWPMLVQAGFKPSAINLKYHKFGLNLFATVRA
ncbi:MAG: methyltransferase domain-containing protein [Planctomycetota bacterium]